MRRPECSFGFEHRRHGIIVVAAQQRCHQTDHALAIAIDVFGGDR